jgi:hypothetical protein
MKLAILLGQMLPNWQHWPTPSKSQGTGAKSGMNPSPRKVAPLPPSVDQCGWRWAPATPGRIQSFRQWAHQVEKGNQKDTDLGAVGVGEPTGSWPSSPARHDRILAFSARGCGRRRGAMPGEDRSGTRRRRRSGGAAPGGDQAERRWRCGGTPGSHRSPQSPSPRDFF